MSRRLGGAIVLLPGRLIFFNDARLECLLGMIGSDLRLLARALPIGLTTDLRFSVVGRVLFKREGFLNRQFWLCQSAQKRIANVCYVRL